MPRFQCKAQVLFTAPPPGRNQTDGDGSGMDTPSPPNHPSGRLAATGTQPAILDGQVAGWVPQPQGGPGMGRLAPGRPRVARGLRAGPAAPARPGASGWPGDSAKALLRDAAEQVYLRRARAREKAEAVRELLALGPIPAPDDYEIWEEQYLREKYSRHG